jgi:ABC-2 type transport system permease protein
MSRALDLGRLGAIARKEMLQLRRDARSLLLAFLLPVVLLALFGYAITWDVDAIAMAIVDQDHTAASRELGERFEASGYFQVRARPESPRAMIPLLDASEVQMVLVVPPGFAADLGAGRTAVLQAVVDGSDANTATIVLAYARAIVERHAAAVRVVGSYRPPITAQSRVWYNDDLSSRNMFGPGLVAVIMMIIATMEQLAATPVTRLEVVLGKLLPYLAIGLADVAVISILGVWVFQVPFRGNVLLFGLLTTFFLAGALGLGMFISATARSQLLATQMAMMATFLPAYLLSGFMFAISAMPKALQLLTVVVPARYFLVVTRGIFLKGVGLSVLFWPGLAMLAFAVLGVLLAVRAFRKELD